MAIKGKLAIQKMKQIGNTWLRMQDLNKSLIKNEELF